MVGIPPTVGFFSKWYLVWAALDAQHWFFAAVILVGSLMSAVDLFRIIELLYLRKPVGAAPRGRPQLDANDGQPHGVAPTQQEYDEIPWLMRIPLGLLSLGILGAGFASPWIVTAILLKVVGHV